MQTGDYFFMIKGYQDGDEVEANPDELKQRFDDLIQEFSMSSGEITGEMQDYCNYCIATNEYNRITAIVNALDIVIGTTGMLKELGVDCEAENQSIVTQLLEGVIVERNSDLAILRQNLLDKAAMHESNIMKLKETIDSEQEKNGDEFDIDDQFLNVFMVLEQPIPDESKLTLYQYSLMVKKAIEKAKQIEKLNAKS